MKRIVFWQLTAVTLASALLAMVVVLSYERRIYRLGFSYLNEASNWRGTRSNPERERYSRRLLSNDEPLIFVGGIPRSGTTLMRAMLDAHEDIRCGEETMIIPHLLSLRNTWRSEFFQHSGLSQNAIDDSLSAFILEMVSKNGNMAPVLCNKDPFTAMHVDYLSQIFPNARFILMIRDARAVVHSMVDRDVPVGGFNRTDPEQMLRQWNDMFSSMYDECSAKPEKCLNVYYERLVQKPEAEARRILAFLKLDWDEAVIRHHELIGGEIKLNPHEFSTSQVKEKVNLKALTSWFDCFSEEILDKVDRLAPMMKTIGYDPFSHKPKYSNFAADDFHDLYN